MGQIKGKQIKNNTLDLEKLRSGSKILPDTATLGSDKSINEITDSREFTTKEYVDDAILSATVDVNNGLVNVNGTIGFGGDYTHVSNSDVSNIDYSYVTTSTSLDPNEFTINNNNYGSDGNILKSSDYRFTENGAYFQAKNSDNSDLTLRFESNQLEFQSSSNTTYRFQNNNMYISTATPSYDYNMNMYLTPNQFYVYNQNGSGNTFSLQANQSNLYYYGSGNNKYFYSEFSDSHFYLYTNSQSPDTNFTFSVNKNGISNQSSDYSGNFRSRFYAINNYFNWRGINDSGNIPSEIYLDKDAFYVKQNDISIIENRTLFDGSGTAIADFNTDTLKVYNTPVDPTDAVNKAYVDTIAVGLDPKESVKYATTNDLSWTYTIDGDTSDGSQDTLSLGTSITSADIDSSSTSGLQDGDRILVWKQADSKQNGIYVVTDYTTGTLTRSSDQDGSPSSEVSSGNYVFVENASYINRGFVLQGNGVLTLNTDELNWVQFSGAGQIEAGLGLSKNGDILEFDINYINDRKLIGEYGQISLDWSDNANVNINGLDFNINSTNVNINGDELNINNVNLSIDNNNVIIDTTTLHIDVSTEISIDATNTTITSTSTTQINTNILDINSNTSIDIDANAPITIDSNATIALTSYAPLYLKSTDSPVYMESSVAPIFLSAPYGTQYQNDSNLATFNANIMYNNGANDNAVPHAKWVKDYVSGNGSTAGNGLSVVSGVIELGGSTLNKDTSISGTGGLSIGKIHKEINNFDVYSKISLNNSIGGFNIGGSGFDSTVFGLSIQSDGKILASGYLNSYNGLDCSNYLTRLNSDGTLDNTFNNGGSGFDDLVTTTAIQSDNKILVGGYFLNYNGVLCLARMVRLNADGTLDNTFNNGGSGFDNQVFKIVIQTDGKILASGNFTSYNGTPCQAGLVRLNSDGTIDNTFNNGGSGFDNQVYDIAIQSDGKILVGGTFSTYNGVACLIGLVRLNSDGTIDNTFNNGGSGFDTSAKFTIQSDGKILVGGSITSYNGTPCQSGLIRLNSDGTLDNTFNNGGSGFDSGTLTLNIRTDNKIVASGYFTSYNGSNAVGYIALLNSDGTLDTTFNAGGIGFDTTVRATALYGSNGIVAVGSFNYYNDSNPLGYIVKLNLDGTLDTGKNRQVLFDGNGVLRYLENYSDNYTDRTLVDKEYVDTIASTLQANIDSMAVTNVWLEQTGNVLSGTSGIVTYGGTFTYPSVAITDADIFVNGVKLRKTEYYFDTVDNYKPTTTSTLYFDLNNLPYQFEIDDYIEVKYLA